MIGLIVFRLIPRLLVKGLVLAIKKIGGNGSDTQNMKTPPPCT
jgi:hypothetical protein